WCASYSARRSFGHNFRAYVLAITDDACWVADDDRIRGDILRDNTSSSDHGVLTDRDSTQDHTPASDRCCSFNVCRLDGPVCRVSRRALCTAFLRFPFGQVLLRVLDRAWLLDRSFRGFEQFHHAKSCMAIRDWFFTGFDAMDKVSAGGLQGFGLIDLRDQNVS